MDYSSGTWAALARPSRPMGAGDKSAYLIGAGAVSPRAAFLIHGAGRQKAHHEPRAGQALGRRPIVALRADAAPGQVR